MPVTEIVQQIDAYLLSLRQARDLLLTPAVEPIRKSPPLRKHRGKIEKAAAAAPSRLRARKLDTPAVAKRARRKTEEKTVVTESVSRAANPVIRREPISKKRQSESAELAPQETLAAQAVLKSETPIAQGRTPVRVVRPAPRRVSKPAVRSKVEADKPAIALAGSMHSRIVVVSAEEARRERDRTTAQAEVKRPRLPSSGLSGRVAFEALFNDVNDSAKNS